MEDDKHIEVGYESVVIKKMFGPLVFHDLRITASPSECVWKIERSTGFTDKDGNSWTEWVEWVQIPGQIDQDFRYAEYPKEDKYPAG